jgi:nucleotide-binding universal stress UspA family protein
MYQKILVAVDNSELSQQAFAEALSMAKAFNSQLHLFHVISLIDRLYPEITPFSSEVGYPAVAYEELIQQQQEQRKMLEVQGIEMLKALQQKAMSENIDTEFTQEIGQTERQICDFAKKWGANLIVMGSHGRTGLSEFFEGSVSNYVAHHVPCSVLIVHNSVSS